MTSFGRIALVLLTLGALVFAFTSCFGDPVDEYRDRAVAQAVSTADVNAREEIARATRCAVLADTLEPITIGFETSSAVISTRDSMTLGRIAGRLEGCPELGIRVVTYADGRGNEVKNLELATRRGSAIRTTLLVASSMIEAARIETVAAGELIPRASDKDASGQRCNRDAEIFFTLRPLTPM